MVMNINRLAIWGICMLMNNINCFVRMFSLCIYIFPLCYNMIEKSVIHITALLLLSFSCIGFPGHSRAKVAELSKFGRPVSQLITSISLCS